MTNSTSSLSYDGHLLIAIMAPIIGTEKWQAKVSISKPKNLATIEHIFAVSPAEFESRAAASAAAIEYGKKIVNGEIPGTKL